MFSQTVEYALRAMMHLAALDAPASGERIALQTHVPAGYLSKVMRGLVVAKLVRSFRGPNGGFVLSRPPREITILDVVNAVDPIHRVHTCPLGNPDHTQLCGLHRRLDDALAHIEQTFKATTLAEVLEGDNAATHRCPGASPPVPLTTRTT